MRISKYIFVTANFDLINNKELKKILSHLFFYIVINFARNTKNLFKRYLN